MQFFIAREHNLFISDLFRILMKKIAIFIFVISLIIFTNSVMAIQTCEIYDDFSTGNLNLTKWTEVGGSDINNLFTAQHFVNETELAFHTAQLTEADRGSNIRFNRNFSEGDVIRYKVNYQSGSGNVLSRLFVNEQAGDTGLQTPECEGQGFATGGAIGYFNGLSCVGQNVKGIYHIEIVFNNNSTDVNFTDPNNNTISYTPIFYVNPPYTVMFGTRAGNNGIVHMDYDDVVICSDDKEEESSLEDRIEGLEERVNELESRVGILEVFIGKIKELLNKLLNDAKVNWNSDI